MSKRISQEIINRIESIEGESIVNVLNRLYVENKMSFQIIMKRWGTKNNRTVPDLLRQFNIPIRTYSENVKLQWVDNDQRKKDTGQRLRQNVSKVNHPNLGKTKETCKRLKESSERMKLFNPSFDESVRIKMVTAKIKAYSENKLNHPNAKAEPTFCEAKMIGYIKSLGFDCLFNYNVGGFWIDVFIPILNIGIECFGANRLPFDYKRHDFITSKNITILYVANYVIKKSKLTVINEYIKNIQILRLNPSFSCKNTMIFGAKNLKPFINNAHNLIIDLINMDKINTLMVSATT